MGVVSLAKKLLEFGLEKVEDQNVPFRFEDKDGKIYYLKEIFWDDWDDEKKGNQTVVLKIE